MFIHFNKVPHNSAVPSKNSTAGKENIVSDVVTVDNYTTAGDTTNKKDSTKKTGLHSNTLHAHLLIFFYKKGKVVVSRPGTGRIKIPFVEQIPVAYNTQVEAPSKTGTAHLIMVA